MRSLKLDFSDCRLRVRNLLAIALIVLLAIPAVAIFVHYRHLVEHADLLASSSGAARPTSVFRAGSAAEDQQENRIALETQRMLNLPWNELLGVLEQAQTESGKIRLLSLQTTPVRNDISLSGESDDFEALMSYLKLLRSKPIFTDVMLVDQRRVGEDGAARIGFTLIAGWRLDV